MGHLTHSPAFLTRVQSPTAAQGSIIYQPDFSAGIGCRYWPPYESEYPQLSSSIDTQPHAQEFQPLLLAGNSKSFATFSSNHLRLPIKSYSGCRQTIPASTTNFLMQLKLHAADNYYYLL